MWLAVAGGPLAWGLQLALGYWAVQAQCGAAGSRSPGAVDAWAIALGAVALALAIAAGLAAVTLYRATRGAGHEDAPPQGRVRFLALAGMAIAPLFACLVVMTGVGLVALPACHGS